MSASVTYPRLTALIGQDAALALLIRHGGRRMHIPTATTEYLSLLVGAGQAQVLVREFGGAFVELPSKHITAAAVLEARIIEMSNKKTVNQIVDEVGLSFRRVKQIIQAHRVSPCQLLDKAVSIDQEVCQ